MSTPGTLIGNYTVERPLGQGGMSEAILARSPTGRLVVLKKPRGFDAELAARLRDEGRLGSRIYHKHLVETLDCFEHQGAPVLVLGYVEGPTVDELRKRSPLSPVSIARIGCQVAEALGAIHDALGDDGGPLGAIHRDVSARNIVVTPNGDAVLIDLGIARFDEARAARTETGMVIGTLRYMAPEIVDGERATRAADFYSLACVLIESFTGQPVFQGPPSAVTAQIVGPGPLPPAIADAMPPALRAVVARMVAKRPAERLAIAHDVSRELRGVEEALGGPAGQRELAMRAAHHQPDPPVVTTGNLSIGDAGVSQTKTEQSNPAPQNPFGPAGLTQPTPTFAQPMLTQPPPAVRPDLQLRQPVFDKPSAPAPNFLPPRRQEAPLELAVEPRRAAPVETMKDPRDWYPKQKRDWSWLTGGASKLLGLVLLVGAALLAWRWYDGEQRAADRRALEAKVAEETKLLTKALEDTPQSCNGEGAYWMYKDRKGRPVIVDAMGKIPKEYRAEARCVDPVRGTR